MEARRKKRLSQEEKEESWRGALRAMHEQFKTQLNENVFEGVRDEVVRHGLKLTSSTIIHKPDLGELCFCPDTKEYLILRIGVEVLRFSMQGKPVEPSFPLEPSLTFSRMIWCDKAKRIVCYDPEGDQVWVVTRDFFFEASAKVEFETRSVFYDDSANELVIIGPIQSVKVALDKLGGDQHQHQQQQQQQHQRQGDVDLETTKTMTYSDPEFGTTWQLEHSALVPKTELSTGLAAVTYHTTIYIVAVDKNFRDEKSKVDDEEESLILEKRSSAHKAAISAIFFHDMSQWIITGDSTGTVSGWSLVLEPMMSLLGVHRDPVRRFCPHPSICGFLSYSQGPNGGNHLQVWSCNFRDKTESFKNLGKISGITVNSLAASIVVLGDKLNYFTMYQVYVFFAPLSLKAKCMSVTTNPMYPSKLVVASEDNSVRLFTPGASRLNVQILPVDGINVKSSAFSGLKDQLFTIIKKCGEILVSDNKTCPMKFKKVLLNDGPKITCFAIYEYFDELRDEHGLSRKPRLFSAISVRLIAGTSEGGLVVLNSDTGKPEARYQGVHKGPVSELSVNMGTKRVVSLGADRCVKVWRVLADLAKPLVLYYSLFFVVPVTHATSMGLVLCIAVSKPDQKYQLLMEHMERRERLLHHPMKDHRKEIVCMIASDRLGICVTSSLDCTVRVWDEENCLRITIEVNVVARPIQFSSAYGDIVFSAGRHLYYIPYKSYLPPKYRARIVANDIYEAEEKKIPPVDDDYKPYDEIVNRNDMLYNYVTTPLGSIDINSGRVRVDVLIMQQICELYNTRDDEIKKMKDCSYKPKKLPGNRALMVTEDWENYVTDLLEKMERVPPEVPKYDFKSIYDANRKKYKSYHEKAIFKMRFGYSVDELKSNENVEELLTNVKLPLHGFLPNSVLYKKKEPLKIKEPSVKSVEKINIRYKYPPEFYPEEKTEIKRQSLRLSQLGMEMGMDNI